MDPYSAGILAAASLIGGLFSSSAQEEQAQKQLEQQKQMQKEAQKFQIAQSALSQAQASKQSALANIIAAYRSGLIG